MEITPATIVVTFSAVFLIAFMKGAFGGGFAIMGIPLLSLVMGPLTAGALLAPLFIAIDVFALRYWKPSTWSAADLRLLLPSLIVGISLGYATLLILDPRAVTIVTAAITLAFTASWFRAARRLRCISFRLAS
jgi:uncharacterized protein